MKEELEKALKNKDVKKYNEILNLLKSKANEKLKEDYMRKRK